MYDAIKTHLDRGILFIAAAGNDAVDTDVIGHYPAAYDLPNIISVAATDRAEQLATFSDYGKRSVHIGAPGVNIYSTIFTSSYDTMSGTSMATPHVTGVAALLKSYRPELDWKAIRNLILAGGDPQPSLAATVATGRRLNAYGSMICTNREITARLLPRNDVVTTAPGAHVVVSVLHINCANPAGTITMTVQPGGEIVTLKDDGTGPDLAAGDGIYTGEWIPSDIGAFTLTISNGDVITVRALKAYSYENTTYSYRTINGTNLNLDDEQTKELQLPFPIRFGAQTFDHIYVSDNGMLSFDHVFQMPLPLPIPYPNVGNVIAPFWDDLQPVYPTDRNVFWAINGAATRDRVAPDAALPLL